MKVHILVSWCELTGGKRFSSPSKAATVLRLMGSDSRDGACRVVAKRVLWFAIFALTILSRDTWCRGVSRGLQTRGGARSALLASVRE
jgi:hypothetical protein